MSCPINRYKFTNTNTNTNTNSSNTAAAKEMEARMKEMLEVRAAQDGGNFKTRPSWDPVIVKPEPAPPTESQGPVLFK
jgi:hypothetical protein